MDDQDIFRQIEELYNNPNKLKKLVKHAHICIKTSDFILPNDYDAEDIVGEVIEKNLANLRGQGFDSSKGSLIAWLKRQIEWEIMNKVRLKRNKSEKSISVDEQDNYFEEVLELLATNNKTERDPRPNNLEDILIDKVNEAEAEEFWGWLYDVVDGDKELEKIVEAIESGFDIRPRNLAKELGWSVDTVYNAKKRFKRRVLPALGERNGTK